jgi:hypothetical protein
MTKIRFVEPDSRVLPEMSAKVGFLSQDVPEADRKPRLALNPAAIVTREGRSVVFVVRDGRAAAVPVRAGQKLGELVEVSASVQPGDKVVLRPPASLKDGREARAAGK